MAAAERRVRRALNRSDTLNAACVIQPQGSYHNNTNVRTESDIDLCVRHTDHYHFQGPPGDVPTLEELGWHALPADSFERFRDDIAGILRDEYGAGAVTVKPGGKSIQLNKDDETKVAIDVVPTHTFVMFGGASYSGRPRLHEGVAIRVDGKWIVSYPRQHLDNGVAKNNRTGRRYKRVVRILKNMRNHCARNTPTLMIRPYLAEAPSFLIESLVYNVPDYVFMQKDTLYGIVVDVLAYLCAVGSPSGLFGTTPMKSFTEVNGIQPLFGDRPPAMDKAVEFIEQAWHYIDLPR